VSFYCTGSSLIRSIPLDVFICPGAECQKPVKSLNEITVSAGYTQKADYMARQDVGGVHKNPLQKCRRFFMDGQVKLSKDNIKRLSWNVIFFFANIFLFPFVCAFFLFLKGRKASIQRSIKRESPK